MKKIQLIKLKQDKIRQRDQLDAEINDLENKIRMLCKGYKIKHENQERLII